MCPKQAKSIQAGFIARLHRRLHIITDLFVESHSSKRFIQMKKASDGSACLSVTILSDVPYDLWVPFDRSSFMVFKLLKKINHCRHTPPSALGVLWLPDRRSEPL
jgi:hypothetical protein